MGVEIERKFLVTGDGWRAAADAGTVMRQGYLVDLAAMQQGLASSSVRVRIEGDQARLNIKSAELGISRLEYEYPVPLADAGEMLRRFCRGTVDKTRYRVPVGNHVYEIDVFAGRNAGLVVAEVELASANEAFERPNWLGKDVSGLPRYYNVSLIDRPWCDWTDAERRGDGDTAC